MQMQRGMIVTHTSNFRQFSSVQLQVESIFRITPSSVAFSKAAATRSLSPNCLFTASPVLCVPSFMRTSTRNLGGRACSKRVLTPKPITVAKEQWVMVGTISTRTVLTLDRGEVAFLIWMFCSWITDNSARLRGCSGSEMLRIRSMHIRCERRGKTPPCKARGRTVDLLLVDVLY